MTEEVYVIQTKTGFKKYPIDKRNKLIRYKDNDRSIVTTMDFLETYHYIEESLALSDIIDMGLSPNEYEVKKYEVTCREVN